MVSDLRSALPRTRARGKLTITGYERILEKIMRTTGGHGPPHTGGTSSMCLSVCIGARSSAAVAAMVEL